VAPADIAIYGTLCALATFPRSAIKAKILENSVFGAYVEQEPYIRELIEAYMNSNFKTVLELLSRYSVRLPSPPYFLFRVRLSDGPSTFG
jgi:COP9 signalosome complex subunit 1